MSKRAKFSQFALQFLLIWLLSFGGCSTTETTPKSIPPISPPEYVQVPHPSGFDMGDVSALFAYPDAPSKEKLSNCETDFNKLRKATEFPRNDDDFKEGVAELLRQDPVFYHWCFYSRILGLETALRAENYIEEKQKSMVETFSYLVPLARGFMKEYRDSRYLRWAIRDYRQLSQWVYFQKVEQSPQMTNDLVDVTHPFGVWREPASSESKNSILEKYHIGKAKSPETTPSGAPIFPATEPDVAPSGAPLNKTN